MIASVATAQSGPTEKVPGSSDPSGKRSASPDLCSVGLTSSDPPGEDSASPDPWESDPLLGVEQRSREGPALPQSPRAHAPDTKRGVGMLSYGLQLRRVIPVGRCAFTRPVTVTGHPWKLASPRRQQGDPVWLTPRTTPVRHPQLYTVSLTPTWPPSGESVDHIVLLGGMERHD
jgi:hypothetical protein